MKKTILFAAFMMACSLVAAQTSGNISLENPEFKYKPYKPVEFSVNAGYNLTSMIYPDLHLTSASQPGLTFGFTAQKNFESIGLRLGASYELNRSYFIDENDPMHSSLSFKQSSINIPVTLLYNTPSRNGSCLYVGAGFNMRYSLGASMEKLNYNTNQLQWNTHIVIGLKFKHLYIEEEFGSQLNDLINSSLKSKMGTAMLKIGFRF